MMKRRRTSGMEIAMGLFSADEVFQIALELEQTGQVFYEAVAIGCKDRLAAELFRRLAQQEAEHYNRFQKMRQSLAGAPEPMTWEGLEFAQALINQRVIPDPRQARAAAAGATPRQALDLAIQMEKDSVLFYNEMVQVMRNDAAAIQVIIQEEKRHAQELMGLRRSAK